MAEVWISNGTGEVVINDVPIIEYFPKQEDRFVWKFITEHCHRNKIIIVRFLLS